MPRVTQAVTDSQRVSIASSHPQFTSHPASATVLADSTGMKHLQLILKRSPLRMIQMEQRIANQHNPASVQFQQWMTPQQFGDAFGVVDGDIAAVSSWLASEGFTVNGVYPNKMQIDFSGTTAQVNQAFRTQETVYKLDNGGQYLANATDISIPAALEHVVTGVVGLSEAPATPSRQPTSATFNPATRRFDVAGDAAHGAHAMAIGPGGLRGYRGLVPDDLANMYGVSRIRQNGVTGKGITIAIVAVAPALPEDYGNFVNQFNLGSYGGTFSQITPGVGELGNCYGGEPSDPPFENYTAAEDLEMATAIAPGANIEVAYCSGTDSNFDPLTSNAYGGLFIAMANLVNGDERPDVLSFTYPGYYASERTVDSASKTALDLVSAQADAEGISVFAGTGDSGSNPDFTGGDIDAAGPAVAALASSPHVTAVGGTDLADELDGTTSQYFSSTPNADYGTALGYVPEIPWNTSCGNGVVAKADGFSSVVDFCKFLMARDPNAAYVTSISGSGG
ncbi:MAG TPA: protease pro-enzyme activation domain-containing protein, partial [Rhodanobacter sp.]